MKIPSNIIREFLNTQAKHVSHYIVAHSYYHPYHKQAHDIKQMTFNLQKDLRHARNCLNKELYGNGARRKPLLYQPLFIPTLEGTTNTANPQLTLHYNIYLGNIPSAYTTETIHQAWTYCWHTKAHQKNDIYIAVPQPNTQSHLINYGTKELQIGNVECWDIMNTQIPYNAFITASVD
jgi:hypothetical protein